MVYCVCENIYIHPTCIDSSPTSPMSGVWPSYNVLHSRVPSRGYVIGWTPCVGLSVLSLTNIACTWPKSMIACPILHVASRKACLLTISGSVDWITDWKKYIRYYYQWYQESISICALLVVSADRRQRRLYSNGLEALEKNKQTHTKVNNKSKSTKQRELKNQLTNSVSAFHDNPAVARNAGILNWIGFTWPGSVQSHKSIPRASHESTDWTALLISVRLSSVFEQTLKYNTVSWVYGGHHWNSI